MIPQIIYLAYVCPLNKFTHPNVHRLLPPAGPILHVPHCTFSCGPYFGERLLLHQVTQIRNLDATFDSSFSFTNWLSSFYLISARWFLSSGHHEDDNALASYNIFLTGLSASSLVIPSNLSFHIAVRVIFQKHKSDQ